MRVPLIKTMNANYQEDALFPALDSSGQIVFSDSDKSGRTSINVDSVEFCEQIGNRVDTLFFIKDLPKGAWQLTFTESRLVFQTPYVASLLGNKAKEKEGSVSAGHIYYKNVAGVRISNPRNDWPFLCVLCLRVDGTATNFLIKADKKELAQITQLLGQYIADFWNSLNVQNEDLTKELLRLKGFDWNSFTNKDQLINLCHAPIKKIHNSLVSANM